jgi:hypothetical protein
VSAVNAVKIFVPIVPVPSVAVFAVAPIALTHWISGVPTNKGFKFEPAID